MEQHTLAMAQLASADGSDSVVTDKECYNIATMLGFLYDFKVCSPVYILVYLSGTSASFLEQAPPTIIPSYPGTNTLVPRH